MKLTGKVISTQYKEEFSVKTIQREIGLYLEALWQELNNLFGETLKREFKHWLRCVGLIIDFIVLKS